MKYLLILMLMAVLAACSKTETLTPDRPGGSEYDYQQELSDASMRFDGLGISLKYDEGGILFDESTDGCISITRLSDDYRVEFNPQTPSLLINGVAMKLAAVSLDAENNGVRWYRLTIDGSDLPVFIVVEL